MFSLYNAITYPCTIYGLLSLFWRVYHFVYLYLISPYLKTVDFKKHGQWAVITGSTDGLGLGYAKYFAKLGMKVVVVGRNPEKLDNVVKMLETNYNVETLKICADFTYGFKLLPNLTESLANLDIGVLVNNVGVSYPYFLPYDKLIRHETILSRNMIGVNNVSMIMLTEIVLPRMVEKNRGVMINISSQAGTRPPSPFLALYSATKAFVSFLSEALSAEYASSGLIIQNVCPSFVSTSMTRMKTSFYIPSVDGFVESHVRTIGKANNVDGYWAHALYALFVPDFLKYWVPIVGWKIMKKNIMKKVDRKAAKTN